MDAEHTFASAQVADISLPQDWREHAGRRGLLLIFIHGPWCHHCLEHLLWLRRKHAWLAERGVGSLAVSGGDASQIEAFQQSLWTPLPFALIAGDESARSATLLVDRAGAPHLSRSEEHRLPDQTTLLGCIERMPAS